MKKNQDNSLNKSATKKRLKSESNELNKVYLG